jgi:hypothetical protein
MLSQTVGDNDGWRIYGEAPSSNNVRMVFELVDDIETAYQDQWVFRNKRTYTDYAATSPFYISGDGNSYSAASSRAPIFYDSGDTGYYVDGNNGSNLKYLQLTGAWGSSPYASGHETLTIRSSYASICQRSTVGAQAYVLHHIDDKWSLYIGRGATDGSSWDWAMQAYPTQDGSYVNFRTSARAPLFYDYNDTGYYIDPNSTTYLYNLILAGGGYFRPSNWIQFDGNYGLYWPNNYGAHLYPNNGSTYTQLRINGSKNGYSGMWADHSGVNFGMYDSSGNGGVYREGNGLWYFYYYVGNGCMGIGTSSTNSSYGVYVVKGGYFDGRVDGTIFYDANNTGYYTDPNGTSNVNALQAYSYQGNGNVGGTGAASWHPSGIYSAGHNWLYGGINGGGASGTNFGDLRATIFYDYNDTGFYVDPNSTSRIVNIRVDGGRYYIDGGATGEDGGNSGQICFTSGGGMTIGSIQTTFVTGFAGSGYPDHRGEGMTLTYNKNLNVVQAVNSYYSDERLKRKTGTLDGALNVVKTWVPFRYMDNDVANSFGFASSEEQIGLSAQEVQATFPQLVKLAPFDIGTDFSDEQNPRQFSKSGENYLTLDYNRLVPVLVQAIKEQQAKIEELESRINNL